MQIDDLVESRRIAAELGLAYEETRACVNLAWNYLTHRLLDKADHWISEAFHLTAENEMPTFESQTRVERALWHEMRGEWEEAEGICLDVLERSQSHRASQVEAAIIRAKIMMRSGRTENVERAIADAVQRAETADAAIFLGSAYSIVAEQAWLSGSYDERMVDRAIEVMELCFERTAVPKGSEIASWLYLAGLMDSVPDDTVEPYSMIGAAKWRETAAWWADRGIPYEQAVAFSLGDTEARLEALTILDRLDAVPLASRIRSELVAEGVQAVPRGPQRATRDHDLGLTARQAEVLELLKEDLTNAEIADRLFISARTVNHHVSAILTKLGASSRTEAVDLAQQV